MPLTLSVPSSRGRAGYLTGLGQSGTPRSCWANDVRVVTDFRRPILLRPDPWARHGA